MEYLLDTFAELATLHAAAATAAERAWSTLANHNETSRESILHENHGQDCSSQKHLMVDATDFTVRWNGQHCHLGPTILFKLIQRLARRMVHKLIRA